MENQAKPAPERCVATIDVGTNTALLLISAWQSGKLSVLHDETRFVRLGEGVDSAGVVNQAALDRLVKTLNAYNVVLEDYDVEDIIIGATSASRDAQNKAELIEYVKQQTGLTYGIISGVEEAEWSFAGVAAGLDSSDEPLLSIDIGGGSTEFTLGHVNPASPAIDTAVSLDIGSVRLTEKFFATQPPSQQMIDEAQAWLRQQMSRLSNAYQKQTAQLVGASGTTTVLGLLELEAKGQALHDLSVQQALLGYISKARVSAWKHALLEMTKDEVLALNPALMKGREDVYPAGILMLDLIMETLNKESVLVNTWGLRHGLALRYWTR